MDKYHQQEAPVGVDTPTGADIETLGASMLFEPIRLYRVSDIAGKLICHPATVYRAIERGELNALRLGIRNRRSGIRVRGEEINRWLKACETVTLAVAALRGGGEVA